MKQIRDDVVACTACSLCKSRNLPVVGQGNHDASVMFVGEAPRSDEDKTGTPFVGAAGKTLDKLLASINLQRQDVYICNVLKCRPPENRDPLETEKSACLSFLTRQIEVVKPKVIVCLGRHSAGLVLQLFGCKEQISMGTIHGKILEVDQVFHDIAIKAGDVSKAELKLMVMYHPAAALYNGSLMPILKDDFQILSKYLSRTTS